MLLETRTGALYSRDISDVDSKTVLVKSPPHSYRIKTGRKIKFNWIKVGGDGGVEHRREWLSGQSTN